MKKAICQSILIFATGVMMTACKKIVQLKVDNIQPKYVIEGNLSDKGNDCTILITTSIGLNSPIIFGGVGGAEVTIREDALQPVKLFEIARGTYFNSSLQAKSGHQYTLDVKINNERFSSTVSVPEKVPFDSLYITDFEAFGGTRKFANVVFQDPPDVPNSYRFLQFKNGVQNSNIFVLNDNFSDGRLISTFLPFFDDSEAQKINIGDTVRVEMQCVDPSVFLYFNSLSIGSSGGNEVVAPGNPVSNIKGGALGYFNAYTKQVKTVIAE